MRIAAVDDKLYELLGDWYLQEVIYEGKRYTYVREYVVLGIQRGSAAMELAVNTFGPVGVRMQLAELSAASRQTTKEVGPAN